MDEREMKRMLKWYTYEWILQKHHDEFVYDFVTQMADIEPLSFSFTTHYRRLDAIIKKLADR